MSEESFKIGGIGVQEVETPAVETPVVETPVAEVPVVETPAVETPAVETPVVETPVAVVPEVEVPAIETPATIPTVAEPVVAEPVKFDNPEMQEFYDFNQNTGLGMSEFQESKKDWSNTDDLTLLKNKLQRENPNVSLSNAQLESLIEKEYELDLSEDLDDAEKLALKLAGGKERTHLIETQQKYNTPKEPVVPEVTPAPAHAVSEQVVLSNGQTVDKAKYESARAQYKTDVQNAVTSLEKQAFEFEIGTGDDKKKLTFEYILEQDDRQSLLSELDNVSVNVLNQHVDDSGNLNVSSLTQAQLMKNEARSQKMIGRLLSLAYAQGQEEVLKQETNITFDTSKPPLPPQNTKPIIDHREDIVTVKMAGF